MRLSKKMKSFGEKKEETEHEMIEEVEELK